MAAGMPTGRPGRHGGFTYIGLLFATAIVAVSAAAVATVWQMESRRAREEELLWVGNEFRAAIQKYWGASPAGNRRYPMRLADLLLDERSMEKRRHLRRIYADPITGKADWGLVTLQDGQIIGVYSLSVARPLKQANFRPRDQAFFGRQRYADWRFVAAGVAADNRPANQRPRQGAFGSKP